MALNFPSPAYDGEIYVDPTSGSKYVYVAASTKWMSIQHVGVTTAYGFDKANAAFYTANAAFDKANTGGGGGSTNLTPVFVVANGAYTVANAAYTQSNSEVIRLSAAYVVANAAFSAANSAGGGGSMDYLYVNTSTSAANNFAGNMANAANSYASSLTPNLGPAFDKANAALANTSGTYFSGDLFFPSGNIGIGHTSANAKLYIRATNEEVGLRVISYQQTAIVGHSSAGGAGGGFYSKDFNGIDVTADASGYGARITSRSGYGAYITSISGSPLVVGKTAGADYLTVTTSGNTGFGTSTPAYKIDVAGAANISNPTLIVAGQNVISTLSTSYDTANAAYGASNSLFSIANTNFAVVSMTVTSLSDSSGTIAWDASTSRMATVTLSGTGRTVSNPTNLKAGSYLLVVKQDAGGSKTITTWGNAFKWPGAVTPTLSTTGSTTDLFSFWCDGTNLYGTYIPDCR